MTTGFDAESTRWLTELRSRGTVQEQALRRLHDMLHGVARAEAARRRGSLPADVLADFDDLCLQAANDAAIAILDKLDTFRGASLFTTWAYKFAVLEVSVRLRRKAWSKRRVELTEASWERLVGPSQDPGRALHARQLLSEVRKLVDTTLTEQQRRIFLSVVVEEVPIDVIAERTGSTRGALYKMLHDARRKIRDALTTSGLLEAE